MKAASIGRATLVVTAGMLLGRITGLGRELVLAAQFGITRDADIAMLAITIPDLLNSVFIGGAVSAVLIPEIHRLQQDSGQRSAQQLVCQFLLVVFTGSLILAGLILLMDTGFVHLLAPGFTGSANRIATKLVDCVLIAFPLCTAAAVSSAALQSGHRVAMPALGTLIFNLTLIIGLVIAGKHSSLAWVGWAVVLGAAFRLAPQVINCLRDGWILRGWESVWKLGRLRRSHAGRYFEALVAISVTLCLPVIGRAFASNVEGGIACFGYSWKLVELPAGLIGSLISMVAFPHFSRMIQEQRSDSTGRLVSQVANLTLLACLPIAVAAIAAALPVSQLLFLHGRVGTEQVAVIANLSRLAFLGLPACVLTNLAIGVCHAHGNTRSPFISSIIALAVFGSGAGWALARWKLFGLMGAVVSTQWLQLVWLAAVIHRRHGVALTRKTGSAATCALASISSVTCLLAWFTSQQLAGILACVASAVFLGMLSFLTSAWCLRKDLPNPRALLRRSATVDAVKGPEVAIEYQIRRAA